MARTEQPDPTLTGKTVLNGGLVSNLCSLGFTLPLITGHIRDLLTHSFQNKNEIIESDLKDFIWNPGEDSNILVEDVGRWRPELTEKRPAILIKRNAYQNNRLGVGDFFGLDPVGDPRFANAWVGSHTIFCLHGEPAAAEILACEVLRRVVGLGPVITQMLDLARYQVMQIGNISQVEESSDNFVVPITVGICFIHEWVVHYEAPALRGVSLSLRSLLGFGNQA